MLTLKESNTTQQYICACLRISYMNEFIPHSHIQDKLNHLYFLSNCSQRCEEKEKKRKKKSLERAALCALRKAIE